MLRIGILGITLWLLAPTAAIAQIGARGDSAPVVDTIIVITHNLFDQEEARSSFLFQAMNSVHITTRSSVVRRELLFQTGEPYDSALVAETGRNLRRMGIFKSVSIDSLRIDRRLAVKVETVDGMTTALHTGARSTGGTFSWSLGIVERNFLGTATRAGVIYRDEPDRTAVTLQLGMDRSFGSAVSVGLAYDDLSDGVRKGWSIGVPWRAISDRRSFGYNGIHGKERILQFRDGDTSAVFQRSSFLQTAHYSIALHANTARYVRVGIVGQLWHGAHVVEADTGLAIPDTTTGALGVIGEVGWARYKVVRYYNGFARDYDVDLSSRITLTAWAAPSEFGYEESGVGADLGFQIGASLGSSFARLNARANGLLTATGVDSGQVWLGLTLATQPFKRNATVLHVEMGAQRDPPPGTEYDIGHWSGPRSFGPHAFTGTRTAWLTVEHRAFVIDEVFGLLGVGFAAFVDYGGAWFADQPRRLGGEA